MRIHHLNCGTMCPLSHPLLNRMVPALDALNLVCHCLLIETNDGLVLVDTGLGIQDVRRQERLLPGLIFQQFSKPKLDVEETAFMQVLRLGFNPKDVKHIIVTHFDGDHIGGIADFPHATIHVSRREWDAANAPQRGRLKRRYFPMYWENNKRIETYTETGDRWMDLNRVQALKGVDPGIQFVSLPGHTEGHSGVLIEKQEIFFTGDAFLLEVQLLKEKIPLPLQIYNKTIHEDEALAALTLQKLRNLQRLDTHLGIVSSHDQRTFNRYMGK